MKIIVDKIVDADGLPITGLSPAIIEMYYKETGVSVIPPVLSELGSTGIYVSNDFSISDTIVMIVDALSATPVQKYSTYIVQPEEKIQASYVFNENKLNLQIALVRNNESIDVTSVTSTLYDDTGTTIETRTGVDNGEFYYNVTGQVDVPANQIVRVKIDVVHNGITITENLQIPTQLIRI